MFSAQNATEPVPRSSVWAVETCRVETDDERLALFGRERPDLIRLAHAMTGSHAVAEDVVQPLFINGLLTYTKECGSFDKFLYLYL